MPRRLVHQLPVLALCVFALALAALAQVPVPPLNARVTDLTGTLTAEQRAALEQRLAEFEARKGSQLAVLMVPTTAPETIEQYGIRVAEQAKVGRKSIDDGAILIVALRDRALRVEVGYGLEGVLPDAVAKRIIEEHIVPRFKQGDFYGGLESGVMRIMSVVEGEPLPPPRRAASGRSPGVSVQELLIIGFLLVFVVGGILRAIFGRFLGSGIIGTIAAAGGWIMLGSLVAAILVGILALFLSLMSGVAGTGRFRRSGWYGGYPVGGGWGGGRSGGGWSGGGGTFGGGGASGRW
ncbi:MAG: YgcG family protein [Candidatus Methylomirabilales bacterium]